jgi:hypothetical protein
MERNKILGNFAANPTSGKGSVLGQSWDRPGTDPFLTIPPDLRWNPGDKQRIEDRAACIGNIIGDDVASFSVTAFDSIESNPVGF